MRFGITISVLISIILISSAGAAVPQVISYQGGLLDAEGLPAADGPYELKFTIWSSATGTTPADEIWSSGFVTVDILEGRFSYLLGSSAPFLPEGLFSDTLTWLGITVGTDPELVPRTKLNSVPFAYHTLRADTALFSETARDAEQLNGINSDAFVQQIEMTSHTESASAHHTKTSSAVEITSGTLDDNRLSPNVVMQDDLTGHTGNQSAHHSKTTSASELTSGTLPDSLLSSNVYTHNDMDEHANLPSAHHAKTTSASELNSGTLADSLLSDNIFTLNDMASHASTPSAHHVKTTSASELTSGLLDDDLLSFSVARRDLANQFSAPGRFDDIFQLGDSALYLNGGGISIGRMGISPAASLMSIQRDYDVDAEQRGLSIDLYNNSLGSGPLYGQYVDVENAGSAVGYRYGVRIFSGEATNNFGISYGIRATAYGGAASYAVYGYASGASGSNYAGYLNGDVYIAGTLSKSGGSFKIDHPLDPANKYLQHSFVESPDMMNIYNGNTITDANGMATVTMPNYFEALNREFRYQLTVIGEFAQAIIAQKIEGNQFTIQTDRPNIEVSWQVTGVRQDKWAETNRIAVEVDKTGDEAGKYLNWKAHNVPPEQAVNSQQLLEDIESDRNRADDE
ncbi:MAG: hypothetical protein P1R58_10025 [bacterium]|nr:hypothetical protein [bacterium]